jgi:hypothetical protein
MDHAQRRWTENVRIFDWFDLSPPLPDRYVLQGILDDETVAERLLDYERGLSVTVHHACAFKLAFSDGSERAVIGLAQLPKVRRNVVNQVDASHVLFMFEVSGSINLKELPEIRDLRLLEEIPEDAPAFLQEAMKSSKKGGGG